MATTTLKERKLNNQLMKTKSPDTMNVKNTNKNQITNQLLNGHKECKKYKILNNKS